MTEPPVATIIGAGPAGTTAAMTLLERGWQVDMLEAGTDPPHYSQPGGNYADLRRHDSAQWRWQLGSGWSGMEGDSPKFRVPAYARMFTDYADANRIASDGSFKIAGMIAPGGMSNAWGCGVAAFTVEELGVLAAVRGEMDEAYARIASRIGISGAADDALTLDTGVDAWAQPAIPMDDLCQALWARRERLGDEVRLGRTRVAVVSRAHKDRQPCDLSGMCLWGCVRQATWSAAQDLRRLQRMPGFRLLGSRRVECLTQDAGQWRVQWIGEGGDRHGHRARVVFLAAGTLATTAIALRSLRAPPSVRLRLLSNPTAAYSWLLPRMLGRAPAQSFGLAQLSLMVTGLQCDEPAHGNLFSTGGLPVREFLPHLPLAPDASLKLLRSLLPSMLVGNLFLPGSLSRHEAWLAGDGRLMLEGGFDERAAAVFAQAKGHLSRAARSLGAWMVPGSFSRGAPCSALHYAGTLPIREAPGPFECGLDGGLSGLPGVYVVDGACLPRLPAKPHTLTLMANAHRIARAVLPR